jgi:hypothetical protein
MRVYKKIVLATGTHRGHVIAKDTIEAIVSNTELPISLSMEFTPSPLDGKIGKLVQLNLSNTNKLYGVFEVPDDVVSALGRPGLSVSVDFTLNKITGASITKTPYKF